MEQLITKVTMNPEDFSEEFYKDLSDFMRCSDLIREMEIIKAHLAAKISLESGDSRIKKTTDLMNKSLNEIEAIISSTEATADAIEIDLAEIGGYRKSLRDKMCDMHMGESQMQYTKVVQEIDKLNTDLEREFHNSDDEKCATVYANFCDISRELHDSKAIYLRQFLKDVLLYWHMTLKEKFAKDFDAALKLVKWPFINVNATATPPSSGNILKMQICAEYLLQVETPEEHRTPSTQPGLLAEFPPLSLPIYYMVEPLRKRFLYHFYGGRQTNRLDKPEWYFTQVLTWIRDHAEFVEKWIQPVMDKIGMHHIEAKLEFMQGLVQFAVEKLYAELPNLRYDDFTFSHSIDEALGFDRDLRDSYFYPPNQPSILNVLTQGSIFTQWINMERKFAFEKMDRMLHSLTAAFEPLPHEDEYKITVCADTFVALLQTIKERYASLPQPGHRLQFLELQVELLDNFRVRLLQVVHHENERPDVVETKIPAIANTAFYIENVLMDWGTMLHYLSLFYYQSQLEAVEEQSEAAGSRQRRAIILANNPFDEDESTGGDVDTATVFADTLSLFRHMRKDLLYTLAEAVVHEARAKSYDYVRERWSAMIGHKELREFSLTPASCPMFEALARRLHQLERALAAKLFTIVWRCVARDIDDYLYERLVLDTRFSEGGAMQLKYDLHRNLLPLFAQYCEKPDYYFPLLKESVALLTMSKGTALLLRDTLNALEGATGLEDRRGVALHEVGVDTLTPEAAIKIINRRNDLTSRI